MRAETRYDETALNRPPSIALIYSVQWPMMIPLIVLEYSNVFDLCYNNKLHN